MIVMTKCQQYEVYAAEEAVPTGTVFCDVTHAQAFVDGLRETWWWERFYFAAPARVEVYFRGGSMSLNGYDRAKDAGFIELAPGQRNVKTVLHELAHILAEVLFASHAHDPYFARTYAVLVYAVLGSLAWRTLQAGYERCAVDYTRNAKEE